MFNENTALIIGLFVIITIFVFMIFIVSANEVPHLGVIIVAICIVAAQLLKDEISLPNHN